MLWRAGNCNKLSQAGFSFLGVGLPSSCLEVSTFREVY